MAWHDGLPSCLPLLAALPPAAYCPAPFCLLAVLPLAACCPASCFSSSPLQAVSVGPHPTPLTALHRVLDECGFLQVALLSLRCWTRVG